MSEQTNIQWTDSTFNPWIGCTKVSAGCANCYAETEDKRRGWTPDGWGKGKERKRTSEAYWKQPLTWNREAEKTGVRRRVFCASLADVFDAEVPFQWRGHLMALIEKTPFLDWQLLTKRPENVMPMLEQIKTDWLCDGLPGLRAGNIWLGTSVENQVAADTRIPQLLAIPVGIRFLSCEPLLGKVILSSDFYGKCYGDSSHGHGIGGQMMTAVPSPISWVICGGESGSNARPMHPDWARSLRDQCAAAGVAFHFKQWGEFAPESSIEIDNSPASWTFKNNAAFHICERGERLYRVGKKRAGRLLDGRTWDEFPEVPQP